MATKYDSSLSNFFARIAAESKPAPKKRASPKPVKKKKGNSGSAARAVGSGINQWIPFEAVNRSVAGLADLFGYGEDEAGFDRANYLRNLEAIRRGQEADYEAHPIAYSAGAVTGALGGGAGLSMGIRGAGAAASRAPGAAGRIGRLVEGSQILRAGEKGKNLAKLAGSGAILGGAETAVRGGDARQVAESAIAGAVAAPIGAKLVDAGAYLARPAVDFLKGTDPLGRFLRRFTTATTEEMSAARQAYQAANNGAEPTLFEILPANDVPRVRAILSRMSPNVQQEAAGAIQRRAQNVQPEMLTNIDRATQTARTSAARGFADDLARSRGATTPNPAETAMAANAAETKVDIKRLRSAEAANIMAPYDNRAAYGSLNALLATRLPPGFSPVNPIGPISPPIRVDDDAERIIRDIAGLVGRSSDDVTIADINRFIKGSRSPTTGKRTGGLQQIADRDGPNSIAARKAINYLQQILARDHPDAAAALTQMNRQWAGKSRIAGKGEGIDEGMKSRTPREAAQDLEPAAYDKIYGTPEGAIGRMIGQTHALRQSVSGTPDDAMRAVGNLADDVNLQQAVRSNISTRASTQLSEAARAQSEGLRRLASLDKNLKDSIPESDLSVLGNALLTFNPASFPLTRLSAAMRVIRRLKLPENADRMLVQNLFSQDSARISAAIRVLNNAGRDGRRSLSEIAGALASAGAAGPYAADPKQFESTETPEAAPAEPTTVELTDEQLDAMSTEELDQYIQELEASEAPTAYLTDEQLDAMSDEELDRYIAELEVPYGRSVVESLFPGAEVTDDLRDPNSELGRKNPGSYHNKTDGAVDVRPIPGMTFGQFKRELMSAGYEIVEAIDETGKGRSRHATGPHWHVVIK